MWKHSIYYSNVSIALVVDIYYISSSVAIVVDYIITLVGDTALTEQLKQIGFNVSFIGEVPPSTWIQLQMKYIFVPSAIEV